MSTTTSFTLVRSGGVLSPELRLEVLDSFVAYFPLIEWDYVGGARSSRVWRWVPKLYDRVRKQIARPTDEAAALLSECESHEWKHWQYGFLTWSGEGRKPRYPVGTIRANFIAVAALLVRGRLNAQDEEWAVNAAQACFELARGTWPPRAWLEHSRRQLYSRYGRLVFPPGDRRRFIGPPKSWLLKSA